MDMVKSLIVTGFGINCEIEMGAAFSNAGAESTIIHFNELLDGSFSIHDYDIFSFPGGFSFGDDISSGKVMANKVKFKKMNSGKTFIEEIDIFLKDGKFIMGVCNGFQMLVKLGLLPNLNSDFEPETSLEKNNSNKYEDRWIFCKVNPDVQTPFLNGIDLLPLPVRHGEGKLIIKDGKTKKQIIDNNLIAMSYANEQGYITDEYPMNPNGSHLNIAALTDPTGQVFGLMPHPEAFLSFYNHPDWPGMQREGNVLERNRTGQAIFDNIVKHIRNKKSKEEKV
jgi:phosphoribosylformylglycinamidine synthase I